MAIPDFLLPIENDMANYLLLRDNKESGPFSLEELVTLGLKPYDLVWVQGKSAAWRYPSEVGELKPYAPVVEEQPFDRFFKKPAATDTAPLTAEAKQSGTLSDEYEPYAPKVIVSEQQQPAAKRSVFVTLPGQVAERKIVAKPAPVPKPKPAPIPDYTLQDQEETISVKEENPVAKIKYSQPLDEIKEMYVKTLKERKDRIARKSFLKISLKRAAVIASLIGIGVLAGFILKSKPAANTALAQSVLPANNTAGLTNEQPETVQQDNQIVDPPVETTPVSQDPPGAASETPPVVAKNAETKSAATHVADPEPRRGKSEKEAQPEINTVKETKKPLAVMPAQDPQKQESQQEYVATETNPLTGERSRTVRTMPDKTKDEVPGSEVERASTPVNSVPSSPDKALSGLGNKVSVNSNDYKRVALGGIRNLELTVSNHSKYDLDEVAVELQYLKPGDQVLKTQIVQFKSVAANASETLRIPDTNRGVKVQYRIVRIGSSQLADR